MKRFKNPKIIITGPSGAGKGTLITLIFKFLKFIGFHFSRSVTTRDLKQHERDGVDYFKVTNERFQEMIDEGLFLEWEKNHEHYYGTLKSECFFDDDRVVVFDLDVRGAKTLKKFFPDALVIFIAPPSVSELKKRLITRARESVKNIESRVQHYIDHESKDEHLFDYRIVNHHQYQMLADAACIIYQYCMGKIIAIDGPAKCGKGAVSVEIAKSIDAHVVPTGDFFRYFGYKLCDDYSERDLKNIVDKFSYSEFDELRDELSSETVAKKASGIVPDPLVRDCVKLLTTMYAYGNHGKKFIVYEGRDTTTRTARYADLKFFVTIDSEIRAKRAQLTATGSEIGWEFMWNELENRDRRDMQRETDPLYHDIDNGVIGVSNNGTLDETVHHILEKHVYPKLKEGTMYG